MLVVFSNRIVPDVLALDVRKQLYQLAVDARLRKTPSSDAEVLTPPRGIFTGLSSHAVFVDRLMNGVNKDDPREGAVVFTLARLGVKEVMLPSMGVMSIEHLKKIARI